MDDSGKFIKMLLSKKEGFCSHLNMLDIIDADYTNSTIIFKDFETKNVVEYHNLYFQNDTLLMFDVFHSFRNMCLETYELDPAIFFSAPRLA